MPDCAAALGLRRGQYSMMESPVGDLMIVVTEDGVADIGYLVNHSRDDIFAELHVHRPCRRDDLVHRGTDEGFGFGQGDGVAGVETRESTHAVEGCVPQ